MEFFIGWFIFSVLAGVIASSKGRSGFGFFLLSMILSPLVGILAAAFMPKIEAAADKAAIDGQVKCPDCAEFIQREAKVCKHCGARFTTTAPPTTSGRTESNSELMIKYGIDFDGRQYEYRGYRYDSLSDAILYASQHPQG